MARLLASAALRRGLAALVAGALPLLAAAADPAAPAAPSARLILVGDSTLAPRTGYGDALCQRLKPQVGCLNLAKGGRSSLSYRAEGLWAQVQTLLRDGAAFQTSYVLIQFGHNDQPGKPGRSTDLVTEFPTNMAGYVIDVKALGGVPVLLTPLTRRSFRADTLHDDLRPWAEAVIRVAAAQQVALVDLNALSAAAVQAMGEAQADSLAMAPKPAADAASAASAAAATLFNGFDHTHLGAKGANLFARMVEQALLASMPAMTPLFSAAP